MFFDEILLFEDELHDHGVSSLSVKIVSSFFFVCINRTNLYSPVEEKPKRCRTQIYVLQLK